LSDTRLPADGGATRAFAVETSKAFTILNLLARNDPQAINTYVAGVDFVKGILRVAKVIGGGVRSRLSRARTTARGISLP
jgi:hypothetical protein